MQILTTQLEHDDTHLLRKHSTKIERRQTTTSWRSSGSVKISIGDERPTAETRNQPTTVQEDGHMRMMTGSSQLSIVFHSPMLDNDSRKAIRMHCDAGPSSSDEKLCLRVPYAIPEPTPIGPEGISFAQEATPQASLCTNLLGLYDYEDDVEEDCLRSLRELITSGRSQVSSKNAAEYYYAFEESPPAPLLLPPPRSCSSKEDASTTTTGNPMILEQDEGEEYESPLSSPAAKNDDRSTVNAKRKHEGSAMPRRLEELLLWPDAQDDHLFHPVCMKGQVVTDNDNEDSQVSASTTPKNQRREQWNQRYEEMMEFRSKYGHCLVPLHWPDNPSLAHWVKRQRHQYRLKMEGKHSTLTPDRLEALEKLGFVWDSHAAAWEERWNQLRDFRDKHGHCHVPKKFPCNPQLAIWVKCQRRQYKLYSERKESNMNKGRIEKLASLGFSFCPRRQTKIKLHRH